MTDTKIDYTEARQQMDEVFPSRIGHLMWQLAFCAQRGQAFDLTFYDREPMLEIMVTPAFARQIARTMKKPFSSRYRARRMPGGLCLEVPVSRALCRVGQAWF